MQLFFRSFFVSFFVMSCSQASSVGSNEQNSVEKEQSTGSSMLDTSRDTVTDSVTDTIAQTIPNSQNETIVDTQSDITVDTQIDTSVDTSVDTQSNSSSDSDEDTHNDTDSTSDLDAQKEYWCLTNAPTIDTDSSAVDTGSDGDTESPYFIDIKSGVAMVSGGITKTLVRTVINCGVLGLVRTCYETSLQANPTLKGRIAYTFSIDENGYVASVTLASSTVGDAQLETCVLQGFYDLVFPIPTEYPVEVTYPFQVSTTKEEDTSQSDLLSS